MTRFAFHEDTPALFQAQFALAAQLGENPRIAPVLRDLIECRVSQINGGDPTKLTMLAVWEGAQGFDEAERAALAWAECLTRTENQVEISKCHRALLDHFEAAEISELTCIISTMNAWNRLGIAQHEYA